MVYGPEDHQYDQRHAQFIKRIIDKRKVLILSDREPCQVFTYGYIENIAAAIVHSFNIEITIGKIYNLGEEKSRTKRLWRKLYGEISNWNFDIQILPEEISRKDRSQRN